ncbi:DNA replication/repair protein RecF [Dinoroseobacter sp. S124A]|uniref:DNA replication/repair protein RecF n=1 Tax=Dinoroseobacter sp. S124A TaxID=3415128 RepID=UPI003C7AEFFF
MAKLAVEHIHLSHFRSHKSLKLDLEPGPVVLYGPNGAGKTNILEALSLLSPGRGLRRAKSNQLARQPEAIGWKITAHVAKGQDHHVVETGSEDAVARTVRIDGKAKPQIALGALVPVVWLVPAMDRLWTEASEGRRRFLDRLTLNFRPDHGKSVLSYEKAMRDRNRLLKDGARDPHWYDALEDRMAHSGAQIVANRLDTLDRITQAQDDTNDCFPSAGLGLAGPDGGRVLAESARLKDALQSGRNRDLLAGRTLSGPHRDDLTALYSAKGMLAQDCSTGEQKALLISLILAVVRSLRSMNASPPLVLLDEVSAHLDHERQLALYDEICALGAQAWLTGTESDLFQGLAQRAQFVEVRDTAT